MPKLLPYKSYTKKADSCRSKSWRRYKAKREREITAVNRCSERYMLQPLSQLGNLWVRRWLFNTCNISSYHLLLINFIRHAIIVKERIINSSKELLRFYHIIYMLTNSTPLPIFIYFLKKKKKKNQSLYYLNHLLIFNMYP